MYPDNPRPDDELDDTLNPGATPEDETPSETGSGSKIAGPLSGKSIASWKELMDTKTGGGKGFDMTKPNDEPFDDEAAAAEFLADDPGELRHDLSDITEMDVDAAPPVETSAIDLRTQEMIDLPYEDDLLSEFDAPPLDSVPELPEIPGSGRVDLIGSEAHADPADMTLADSGAMHREDDEFDTLPLPTRKSKKPLLLTGIGGGLGGAAILGGLWYAGMIGGTKPKTPLNQPVKQVAKQPPTTVAENPTTTTPPTTNPAPTMTPAPTPTNTAPATAKANPASLDAAMNLLQNGDFDAAVTAFEQMEKNPQVQEAAGQARWLRYFRNCKQSGSPMSAEAEDAKAATQSLREANTAMATLWLGLIEEATGKSDEAKKIYTDGQTKFPDQARLFQAALDRLESSSPRAAAPFNFGVAVFTVLVAVAETPDEPGFKYWEAMKLAKKNDYAAAQAALKQARDLHDTRRGTFARKGMNPQSDPMEDIFLRSCDELQAYWTMCDNLHNGGYSLASEYPNASAALKALMSKNKTDGDTIKKLNADLNGFREIARQAKLDPNDFLAAIQKMKTAADDAQKEMEKAKAATVKATLDAKTATDAMKDLEAKLAAATESNKTLEEELKKAKDSMAGMKPTPAPAPVTPAVDTGELTKAKAENMRLAEQVKTLNGEKAATQQQLAERIKTINDQNTLARQQLTNSFNEQLSVVKQQLEEAKQKPVSNLPQLPPAVYSVNPLAERAFANGVSSYRNGDMMNAITFLEQAIRVNNLDARYWYFLGLSRSGMGDEGGAEAAMHEAVERERRNLPNPGVVDRMMERMPVETRAAISQARSRG